MSTASANTLAINQIYSEAKKALNASMPDRVVCRLNESQELESYLLSCFKEKKTLSLYVNGQPGTGKTLSCIHLLDNLKSSYKFKLISLNCMSIKNIQALYKLISQELTTLTSLDQTLTPSKRATKDNLAKTTEQLIVSNKIPIVLVIDEIDQIETAIKTTTDLYRIFEWPFLPNSKLILIGIANSLDFTDRLLPRLELKPECKPKILKFLPYSKEDIISIVRDRLKPLQESNNNMAIIDDRALTLCASKLASTSGDIRKVLDICRRAIELVEQETKFNTKEETSTPEFKPVNIGHMMRVFNQVNPMTNSNLDKNTMPLMQKILLCTILLCNKEMKVKEIAFSKLYDKFNKICKAYSTEMGSESEFLNLCNLVQDLSLIAMKKAKEVRNHKVSLRIDEQELRDKLQDETFMADILNNKSYR